MLNRAGRSQRLRLQVRGAELHLARTGIAGGRDWRLERSLERSNGRRIRRCKNRGHDCARFDRRDGALARSDASGGTRRTRAKTCARATANHAAVVSRCASRASSNGCDADEYGGEHAWPRERSHAARFAGDARSRITQSAPRRRHQRHVHISRDQYGIGATYSDDCDRDFGRSRIHKADGNSGHGTTSDFVRCNHCDHRGENSGEVAVVRTPCSCSRWPRLGRKCCCN